VALYQARRLGAILLLKTRIIPVVLYRGTQAIKGKQFDGWRSVGSVVNAVRVHARRQVDELILLDVGATPEARDPDFALIRELSAVIMSPLTVGGGITSVEHFREALRCGADKVAVRTAALRDPDLISRAAERFGRQAVTVALDCLPDSVCDLDAQVGIGSTLRRSRVVEAAKRYEHLGAGELLVTSVLRDGCLCGYDIDLLRDVSRAVSIPVVANGGAGNYADFCAAIRAGAHAVAAGALWQFTDATPMEACDYLASQGFLVRLDHIRGVDEDADRARHAGRAGIAA
jgi:cyclase